MKPPKKAIIVFAAGMGDGLQMAPLWCKLRARGYHLTLLTVSPYFPKSFAQSLKLVDEIIEIKQKRHLGIFVFKNLFRFDHAFFDYYSSSPLCSLIACLISKKAVTNRSKWYLKLLPNLKYRPSLPNAHNIQQNLLLAYDHIPELHKINYKLPAVEFVTHQPHLIEIMQKKDFVIAQTSAANKLVEYKNWPEENWVWLLKKINKDFPSLLILLVGDENEVIAVQNIADKTNKNIIPLAGKTSLLDLGLLISKAKMYIGLDSGPMHLAAMLGIPTFTLWGPSDPKTIGYEVLDKRLHKDVCLYISCHPCLSFIRHNTSLVDHPAECPNPRCIKDINRESVWKTYQMFWEQVYGNQ